jgi:hypothetical protein
VLHLVGVFYQGASRARVLFVLKPLDAVFLQIVAILAFLTLSALHVEAFHRFRLFRACWQTKGEFMPDADAVFLGEVIGIPTAISQDDG